ncbi:hypothetical protein GE061_012133 [Apolygus lucorum]|uniref:Uncharacterized protein n=1 Tax=Apolygus lucorum TaxID=248454 RepID=A0A6A4JNV8_APOLU|nr:hypothetical protein GE061_012133 [Apolygus lucorum]
MIVNNHQWLVVRMELGIQADLMVFRVAQKVDKCLQVAHCIPKSKVDLLPSMIQAGLLLQVFQVAMDNQAEMMFQVALDILVDRVFLVVLVALVDLHHRAVMDILA